MKREHAVVVANLLVEPAVKILKASIIEAFVQDVDEFSFKYDSDDLLDEEGLDGFSAAFAIARTKAEYETEND